MDGSRTPPQVDAYARNPWVHYVRLYCILTLSVLGSRAGAEVLNVLALLVVGVWAGVSTSEEDSGPGALVLLAV